MYVLLGAVHILVFVAVFVSIIGEVDFVHLDWRVECDSSAVDCKRCAYLLLTLMTSKLTFKTPC